MPEEELEPDPAEDWMFQSAAAVGAAIAANKFTLLPGVRRVIEESLKEFTCRGLEAVDGFEITQFSP